MLNLSKSLLVPAAKPTLPQSLLISAPTQARPKSISLFRNTNQHPFHEPRLPASKF
jgi:hypothetical protein